MAKILIAEDDKLYRSLLVTTLEQWGYEVGAVDNGLDAWHELTSFEPPDIALLDWIMPGLDGVEICRRMKSSRTFQNTYLIILSARKAKQDMIAGLRAGANDFLTKPFNPGELEARLIVGMRSVRLREELESSREKLIREATHDELTEILNRRGILDALKREHLRAARESSPLSVVLIDVDHFKKFNDTLGHQGGDRVLIELAERISSSLRGYDSVGRFGGEEFLVVLPGASNREAYDTAERIRRNVVRSPFDYGEKTIEVNVSAGVATMSSRYEDSADLVRRADEALYLAKRNGRNRVEASTSVPVKRTLALVSG